MHVREAGDGPDTVVLLPGMGIALPSADFGPLQRELAARHRVVVVEYFGTGFSGGTDRPRTSANYVEEIRAALSAAGYEPPYVLMPHSISGVYAEHYAATYPDEVEAIVSLDGTPTVHYEPLPPVMRFALSIGEFQQAAGTTAVLARLTMNRKKLRAAGYTDRELDDLEPQFSRCPNVNFILGHAGAVAREHYVRLGHKYANVYLELCFSACPRGLVEYFVGEGLAAKLLWGSDCIFMSMEQQIGRVIFAQISEQDKRLILGETAARVLLGR